VRIGDLFLSKGRPWIETVIWLNHQDAVQFGDLKTAAAKGCRGFIFYLLLSFMGFKISDENR